jgi:pyridoxine 5-phosphate synthase
MKTQFSPVRLGVNVDHVATLRQARGTDYPDPVEAAVMALKAGADSITVHLREDRRHIQDMDVWRLKKTITAPINLEMAATEEIIQIAEKLQPKYCCLVPEKRAELTTEGGLDLVAQEKQISLACRRLQAAGITVSLFIDPDLDQIAAAKRCGAPVIELNTGRYTDAPTAAAQDKCLKKIQLAAQAAAHNGLTVNAGHGLHYGNVSPIAEIPEMYELNIGHSLIAYAVYWGIEFSVKKMIKLIDDARKIR